MVEFAEVHDRHITRQEFDNELIQIRSSLKVLDAHVIKSNLLQEITNDRLSELKELMFGESERSFRNRIDLLEKKESTRKNYERFITILLIGIISLEPFMKFATHLSKLYYG